MEELSLQIYPAEILRQKALPVTEFNDVLSNKIKSMLEIMYEEKGIGLAGNQAGIAERIIVADLSEEKDAPKAYINLEITEVSKETDLAEEGCLSLPGIYEKVTRNTTISIKYQDESGNIVEEENIDGLYARCMQHELDHLNGRLFIDIVSPIRKIGLKKQLKAFEV